MDISISEEKKQKSITVFCCYAHEDENLLKKLKGHLSPLQHQGLITVWHDRNISAGAIWEEEIKRHLSEAQIILLLISPDFMNSQYCYSVEMQHALERHKNSTATVIPVILRHTYWHEGPLATLQALPTDGRPVTSRGWDSLDEAFYTIVLGIRREVDARLAEEERLRKVEEEKLAQLAEEEKRLLTKEVKEAGKKRHHSTEEAAEPAEVKEHMLSPQPLQRQTNTQPEMLPNQLASFYEQSLSSSVESSPPIEIAIPIRLQADMASRIEQRQTLATSYAEHIEPQTEEKVRSHVEGVEAEHQQVRYPNPTYPQAQDHFSSPSPVDIILESSPDSSTVSSEIITLPTTPSLSLQDTHPTMLPKAAPVSVSTIPVHSHVSASVPVPAYASVTPATRSRLRRFLIIGLTALLIVALASGMTWLTTLPRTAPPRVSTIARSTTPTKVNLPVGRFTEFAIPTSGSQPEGITAGPDGNLWSTNNGANQIERVTLVGKVTKFAIPTSNSEPEGITAGPDGNLWFTEYRGDQIGRITPAGNITEFAIPTSNSTPDGITAGPDGNLWFTEHRGNQIGRIAINK